MDAVSAIKGRRSVRKYTDQSVDREILRDIVEISRYAPSWGNLQVARYTVVDDQKLIREIAEEGVRGFVYNIDTLKAAKGVVVLSYVKGKSGKLDTDAYVTSKEDSWEIFDAGIACQTFCLAAHTKGIGTVIMGVIDDDTIARIAGLPEEETVAALIVYGYPEGEAKVTTRKRVNELLRFAGE